MASTWSCVTYMVVLPSMNLLPAHCHEQGGHLVLHGAGFELRAPQWLRASLKGPDHALTVGIRPQSLRVVAASAPLAIDVDVVEYLGTESQVVGALATAGGPRVTATVPGDAHALVHTRVGLAAEPDQLHIFDTASGAALRP
jgi:ABC-type sugar transport system ATPase subunit